MPNGGSSSTCRDLACSADGLPGVRRGSIGVLRYVTKGGKLRRTPLLPAVVAVIGDGGACSCKLRVHVLNMTPSHHSWAMLARLGTGNRNALHWEGQTAGCGCRLCDQHAECLLSVADTSLMLICISFLPLLVADSTARSPSYWPECTAPILPERRTTVQRLCIGRQQTGV